jgi:hypothetical protein
MSVSVCHRSFCRLLHQSWRKVPSRPNFVRRTAETVAQRHGMVFVVPVTLPLCQVEPDSLSVGSKEKTLTNHIKTESPSVLTY